MCICVRVRKTPIKNDRETKSEHKNTQVTSFSPSGRLSPRPDGKTRQAHRRWEWCYRSFFIWPISSTCILFIFTLRTYVSKGVGMPGEVNRERERERERSQLPISGIHFRAETRTSCSALRYMDTNSEGSVHACALVLEKDSLIWEKWEAKGWECGDEHYHETNMRHHMQHWTGIKMNVWAYVIHLQLLVSSCEASWSM